MECRFSNALNGVAAALGLTVALVTASGGIVMASAPDRGMAGTWVVQVTIRDCATSAPLGPSFNSLVTFHRGGTLSESAGSLGFVVGQRSSGHGTWTHEREHIYGQRMVALMLFDTAANLPGSPGFNPALPISPGFFAGWQTITQTLELSDADNFTSAGTNAFYKLNGEVYRTGCSTASGHRFN